MLSGDNLGNDPADDLSGNRTENSYHIDASIFDGNEASALNGSGGFGSALLGFNANINITNSLFINQNAEMGATILNLAFNNQVDEIRLINCTFAQNENSGTATLVADNLIGQPWSASLQSTPIPSVINYGCSWTINCTPPCVYGLWMLREKCCGNRPWKRKPIDWKKLSPLQLCLPAFIYFNYSVGPESVR